MLIETLCIYFGMGNIARFILWKLLTFLDIQKVLRQDEKIPYFKTLFCRSLLFSNMYICYPRRKYKAKTIVFALYLYIGQICMFKKANFNIQF